MDEITERIEQLKDEILSICNLEDSNIDQLQQELEYLEELKSHKYPE